MNNLVKKRESMIQMNGFVFSETKSLSQRKEIGSRSPGEEFLTSDGLKNTFTHHRKTGYGEIRVDLVELVVIR